ncbi:MAG: HAD-IC family P-type ATPase [Microthrixaceae bacterium]
MTATALPDGLSSAEVAERVASGRVNRVPRAPTRTVGEIVRANVLTPVNGIIGVLLVLVVLADGIGPDMLFAGVIVSNSVIGIAQELRARAALNRLAVLTAPHARARRDGAEVDLDVDEVVQDDLLVLSPGAQVVVDGEVVSSNGLELNESLLTGESDAVHKPVGAEVLSGSFVAAGGGAYRAVKVGADSYAASLAEEARRFTLVDSELRRGVNRILRFLMYLIPPVALVLFWRLLRTGDGWQEALSGVVAACVAMVPDGLVLLTSLAFMAGVVSLARRQALLRELASVELLARVDMLCLDKTGTITTGQVVVTGVEPLGHAVESGAAHEPDPSQLLAAVAAADPDPNPTLAAVAAASGAAPPWQLVDAVPFSSARKWSGARFEHATLERPVAVYLGAPELLLGDHHPDVGERVAAQADQGRRVLLMATAATMAGEELPDELTPVALVLLEDEVRPDAEETLEYFSAQGIALKVISGDHPRTVAAVARRAGVPGAEVGVDARELPEDPDELAAVVESHAVFGRVTPRQKRAMVLAMQDRGHVVAMTGDGVNDVLALKDADMGIAMGSGSEASRSVAQLVLMDDRFSSLPSVLAEGRRVMNSVERAANLFIYGTVYAVVMAAVISLAGVEFPFLPRHLTLVRTLSVGIPGFVLALAPDARRARPGFLPRVVRFAIPAGGIAGTAALSVYFVARSVDGTTLTESRTAATVTLLGVGLGLLVRLTSTLPAWRWALVAAMAVATGLALVVPPIATFFDLAYPPAPVWWTMAAVPIWYT